MYTPDSLRAHHLPMTDQPPEATWVSPPFIPPPSGATNGGQPGGVGWGGGPGPGPGWGPGPGSAGGGPGGGPGWGNGNGYPSTSDWPRRQYNGTPYPHNTQLPTSAGPGWAPSGSGAPPGWPTTPLTAPPMNTAHSWAYGQGASTPNSPWHAHTPAWGQTRETGWGAHTPGGGAGGGAWGAAPPQSPYVPWGQPSPYTAPAGVPPASPYDSASGQPITGGWFGTGGGAAAANVGGGGGWGGGVWQDGMWIAEKKHKKRRSDHGHGGFGHERHHDSDSEEPNYFGRSTSMRRTHSNRASPRRSKSLQRSASWGNGNANANANGYANANGAWGGWSSGWWGDTPPQYAQNDLFDAHNLARRPRDWRPDYSPRGGLGAYIPKIGNKSWTTVKEWSDPVRRSLHPLLAHDPANPPIYYDLRSPTFDPRDVSFLNLPSRRSANEIDFAQLALQPSSAFMRIFHPKLPWYIDVSQSHPNGVTVFNVLSQMHAQLHASIHPRHFWNEELGEQERGVLTRTFQERVKGDPGAVQRGILQVDFLGEKCVLQGLVRGPRGHWEMKLGREQP